MLKALDHDHHDDLPDLARAAAAAAHPNTKTKTLRALNELNRGLHHTDINTIIDAFTTHITHDS
ncbi:hypothetical protein [Saccharothrix sp. NRRL B-16314]|uniref:hypothetical protein n=1 Tax=Saccharothrix sp. NRRL B-16314 TaxID=1463825 RepID=UPI000527F532|nr:hypothetical protein [Saccharothrix sp. NRRL B-16314]